MKRLTKLIAGVVLVVCLAAPSARAASTPVVAGHISGVELFPQYLFGSAGFFGTFQGQIGIFKSTTGIFSVTVKHDALPPVGQTARITGGDWLILGGLQLVYGQVISGSILNNGDNTYTINAVLQLANHGGEVYFRGILDHNPLYRFPPSPPTIDGNITQTIQSAP